MAIPIGPHDPPPSCPECGKREDFKRPLQWSAILECYSCMMCWDLPIKHYVVEANGSLRELTRAETYDPKRFTT